MRRKVAHSRIDLRTTPQRKSFFELAAYMGGYRNLSNFMSEASEILAKRILENINDSRELSEKDRDLLLKFLNNPPEPNDNLKAVYQKISKLYNIDENGQAIYEIDNN